MMISEYWSLTLPRNAHDAALPVRERIQAELDELAGRGWLPIEGLENSGFSAVKVVLRRDLAA
jgi:hypothetical protein